MTAINIVKLHDAICVISDGAAYDQRDGTLHGLHSKVALLAHLPAVITGRGPAIATEIAAFHLGMKFGSLDDLVNGIDDIFEEEIVEDLLAENCRIFHLYIIGYSRRRDAFEAYAIVPKAADDAGKHLEKDGVRFEPSKLTSLNGDNIAPMFEPSALRKAFDPLPATAAEIAGCDEGARALLELQRELVFDPETPCVVGGFGQRTILRRDAIETRILCRWPDVPGQRIVASPFDWPAFRARWRARVTASPQIAAIPLNRAQRRARRGTGQ